jgi:hypothetical protein
MILEELGRELIKNIVHPFRSSCFSDVALIELLGSSSITSAAAGETGQAKKALTKTFSKLQRGSGSNDKTSGAVPPKTKSHYCG